MGTQLNPGTTNIIDNDAMADMIDAAFIKLLSDNNLPAPSTDLTDPMVRSRRCLFVAIASGVIQHLHDNAGAFTITIDQSAIDQLPSTIPVNSPTM